MTKQLRDVFRFSLGGFSSALPFASMPAIADNALNQAISQRIEASKADRGVSPRSQVQPGNAVACSSL